MKLDELAALILAGGASRRFGRDKALATVNGTSLLERVAASLDACAPRLIVAPPGRYHPDGWLDGWRLVSDTRPGEGPLAGLEAGLSALGLGALGLGARELDALEPGRWTACAAVDLPHLTPDFWSALAGFVQPGAQAVIGHGADGRAQPLAALYHASALPVVSELLGGGERRLSALLEALKVVNVGWDDLAMPPEVYHNVNRPEDLPGD